MDNLNLQEIEGYVVQLVSDGVWAIDEFGTDIIYLVEGTEKAAVVDTGAGFGNLKKVIEKLTDRPYVVLNTHGHIDHAGGNFAFQEAYLGEPDFKMAGTESLREGWNDFCEKMNGEPDFYGEGHIRENCMPGACKMLPLKEHQIFKLGNRELEVLFVPGHTPGSAVFLDRKNKLLFSGDSVVSTPILIFDTYSATIQEYVEALKALNQEAFQLIFPGHYLRPIGKKVLHDLIICGEKILNGEAEPEAVDFSHLSSEPAFLYRYESGSIVYNDDHIK